MTEAVKGFRDYTGIEALRRNKVRKIVEETFKLYGFEPAETPVIESEDFVLGENQGDEAVSDTYKLKDKGDRRLALRYEFTFQLKRIAQGKKLPYRRYQIGEVFRDEPVSENRLRQFTQCDYDIIGSTIKDDAEIIALAADILKKLRIKPVIYVNNRKLMNEILAKAGVRESDRKQVIREIDKLDKLSEREVEQNLKNYKAESVIKILKQPEKSFESYPSYKEIKELKEYCENFGVKVEFLPYLARGLSYYTGTVFEIKGEKMKQTIFGGGSYMINGIQAVGFSTSLERLTSLAKLEDFEIPEFLVISLDKDKEAIALAQKIRSKGKSCIIYYGKPSKALEYANSYFIQKVVFVG
ncbi:ATP phosphoribosyltransferase regulatory subunit, partial [Candidatus Pacearchaeota archaeon]|nr:ATP phosphoribosyltransferase regulatory subunit [Candidatus Pacearchaeota archaeon]